MKLLELLGSNFIFMVLFGSKAHGNYDEDSDIDVVIILNYLDKDIYEEALRLLSLYFVKEGIFEPEIAHIFFKTYEV